MSRNPNPSPRTRFKPGQSGNPGGRPKSRNKLTKEFIEALAADFETHGAATIKAAREIDPMGYVRMVSSLLPKEFAVERPLESMSDEELVEAIELLKSAIEAKETTH